MLLLLRGGISHPLLLLRRGGVPFPRQQSKLLLLQSLQKDIRPLPIAAAGGGTSPWAWGQLLLRGGWGVPPLA